MHIINYKDNSLQCHTENEDYEEATVDQIAAKHQKTSEDQETSDDRPKRE
jgi:protein-arginine kinase activator protein McsA